MPPTLGGKSFVTRREGTTGSYGRTPAGTGYSTAMRASSNGVPVAMSRRYCMTRRGSEKPSTPEMRPARSKTATNRWSSIAPWTTSMRSAAEKRPALWIFTPY